jgi:hypothetical protein
MAGQSDLRYLFVINSEPSYKFFLGSTPLNFTFPFLIFIEICLSLIDNNLLDFILCVAIGISYFFNFNRRVHIFLYQMHTVQIYLWFYLLWQDLYPNLKALVQNENLSEKVMGNFITLMKQYYNDNSYEIFKFIFLFYFNYCFYSKLKISEEENQVRNINPIQQFGDAVSSFATAGPANIITRYKFIPPRKLQILTNIQFIEALE